MVKDHASLADWCHNLTRKFEGGHSVDVIGLGYVRHLVPHKTLVVATIDVTQRAVFWRGVIQADPCGEYIITAGHAKVPAKHRGAVSTFYHRRLDAVPRRLDVRTNCPGAVEQIRTAASQLSQLQQAQEQ